MVKRVRLSERDRYALNRLESEQVNIHQQPENYKDTVVTKPWGFEYLIFENKSVGIWFLHVRHGHGTSMHCHPKKKTSMVLLTGEALCSTFHQRNWLNGLEAIILDKGVFHSTQSLSVRGINMIEIETPPEKTDLLRLDDTYGRELSGYEGLSEMQRDNLEKFGHFYVEASAINKGLSRRHGEYEYVFETPAPGEQLNFSDDEPRNTLYILCQGKIVNKRNDTILDVGETERMDALREYSGLIPSSDALLLKLRPVGLNVSD